MLNVRTTASQREPLRGRVSKRLKNPPFLAVTRIACVSACVLFFAIQVANGQNITTVAGGPPPNNFPALSPSLVQPEAVAAHNSGNFYFPSQGLRSVLTGDP